MELKCPSCGVKVSTWGRYNAISSRCFMCDRCGFEQKLKSRGGVVHEWIFELSMIPVIGVLVLFWEVEFWMIISILAFAFLVDVFWVNRTLLKQLSNSLSG